MSAEFLLTSLVVVLIPGTGVIYTLAVALGGGFRASVAAALGCTLGIVPHIFASVVGLSALLHASALLFQVVKYAGVAYLLYMAFTMLRGGGALDVGVRGTRVPALRLVRDGLLLNILNPKLSLFFLAFLPQFVPAETAHATPLFLTLAAVFMAMTFLVFVGYGAGASAVRDHVVSRPAVVRGLRRSFAAAFAALGFRLAFAER